MSVDQTAAELDALGIDSPELRVLAARDYIAEQEQAVSRQINAVLLIAEFADAAEANALRRGEPRVRCVGDAPCECIESLAGPRECARAWGPQLVAADYLTARSTVLKPYTGKARDRALEILDEYVPPALRVSDKHRVRA